MKNFFTKTKVLIVGHKIITGVVVVIVLLGGYSLYKKHTSTAGDIRYVTTKAEMGNIISSISGTGQVSASNQIDIKPKASGDIVYIHGQNGDHVSSGAVIAEVDPTDAQKAVRDAQASLESAQISLEKLKIQNSEANMSADLTKAYDNGISAVSDTFLDLPTIVNGLENMLAERALSDNTASSVSKVAEGYRSKAETAYFAADKAFTQNQKDFVALNTNSSNSQVEAIIGETYQTSKAVTDAVKIMLDFANYMSEHASDTAPYSSVQPTLSTYTNTISGDVAALSNAQTDISNNKDTSQSDTLDLRSSELTVTQKQNALQDAKDKLADYYIRAPFSGTLTAFDLKKGDTVSSGTTVATIITKEQIAEISMNEVDAAKIKIGQKATLTFDAIPGLTITGSVSEIDSIGTVSQGVVTYNVKITFDTQDDRIKPGMSVSAAIITDMKQDVLMVPNSAIKSQNGASYVEMFEIPVTPPTDGLMGSISLTPPNKVPVTTGISNDSDTEILSGLHAGDEVVSRTIAPSSATAAAAPSLFGGGGTRTGATGAARTVAR